LRKSLFGNIVLSGGSTLTKGFGNRLLHEVQRLAVKDMRIKILAPPERIYTTWTGGSILAGLSTFKKVSCPLGTEDLTGALTKQRCGLRRMNGKKTQTSSIRSLPRRSVWHGTLPFAPNAFLHKPPSRFRNFFPGRLHNAWNGR
jgi:hypothetical protein